MSTAEMPTRTLGRTGETASMIGLGGWHLGLKRVDAKLADRIMRSAADRGINFFDNSWDYNDGESEKRMGKVLSDGYRDRIFLMTKINGRTKKEAAKQLDESLKRLKVDCIDLVQHHEVIRFEDPNRIFAEDGANAALVEARREGKLKYIGFTGHKDPRIHLKMLRKPYAWDAVLMPINVMDAHYRSFLNEVVPVCHETGAMAIGMKGFGGGWPNGRILERMGDRPGIDAANLLRFNLGQPIVSQVIGIRNLEQLRFAASVARNFQPMLAEEQDALLKSVVVEAGDGRYETFKSTNEHDGPHHRAQHNFALA